MIEQVAVIALLSSWLCLEKKLKNGARQIRRKAMKELIEAGKVIITTELLMECRHMGKQLQIFVFFS